MSILHKFRYIWIFGIISTGLIIIVPAALMISSEKKASADPWENIAQENEAVDHSALLEGSYTTGSEVTAKCLECHPDAATEVMGTSHFTWESEPIAPLGETELVTVGKANSINNFCIGIQSNWTGCTRCHAGYGWSDASFFETATETSVDCLVCHDQSGTYAKAASGQVAEGVDLTVVAQSVGIPTRENCGSCHFNGGGGNGVKHGDLDESLYFPTENLDVHMGKYDFECVDCHKTEHHQIQGQALSVNVNTTANQVYCTDCHDTELHEDERITEHLDSVACQTCHIPATALRDPTKIYWDWSEAGQDREEDPHIYLKIKGSFIYTSNLEPTYAWYNGWLDRYILGDPLDPDGITAINAPLGDINDPDALIYPFKVHLAKQPYDVDYNYLLQPQTVGTEGYWTTFDWKSALVNGSAAVGLPFSGNYDFATTEMYMIQTHMVAPSSQALQCTACHGETGRIDWASLGYLGDPLVWGGRD